MTTTQTKTKKAEPVLTEHCGLMLTPEEVRAVQKGHMIVMESLRTMTISNTTGHACRFEARTPRLVPRMLVATAMEKGCAPLKKSDVKVVEELERATHASFEPGLRRALLFRVLDSLAKNNDTADFAASGVPHKATVEERLGFTVTLKDLTRAWQEYQSIMNGSDPQLPDHPNVEAAYKVVNAEDRDELLLVGIEMDFEESKLEGLQNRELRQLLLGHFKG